MPRKARRGVYRGGEIVRGPSTIFCDNQKGTAVMARHPNKRRKPKPKKRRVRKTAPPNYEYCVLRARKIRRARRCLVALVIALVATGVMMCIFR